MVFDALTPPATVVFFIQHVDVVMVKTKASHAVVAKHQAQQTSNVIGDALAISLKG